eukprot:5410558-Karenia_brevis.AAC.1
MDGRQTVPRAEMTAVIRALLHVKTTGLGVTKVTTWSDSKVVVQGLGGLLGAGRGYHPKGHKCVHPENNKMGIGKQIGLQIWGHRHAN